MMSRNQLKKRERITINIMDKLQGCEHRWEVGGNTRGRSARLMQIICLNHNVEGEESHKWIFDMHQLNISMRMNFAGIFHLTTKIESGTNKN